MHHPHMRKSETKSKCRSKRVTNSAIEYEPSKRSLDKGEPSATFLQIRNPGKVALVGREHFKPRTRPNPSMSFHNLPSSVSYQVREILRHTYIIKQEE